MADGFKILDFFGELGFKVDSEPLIELSKTIQRIDSQIKNLGKNSGLDRLSTQIKSKTSELSKALGIEKRITSEHKKQKDYSTARKSALKRAIAKQARIRKEMPPTLSERLATYKRNKLRYSSETIASKMRDERNARRLRDRRILLRDSVKSKFESLNTSTLSAEEIKNLRKQQAQVMQLIRHYDGSAAKKAEINRLSRKAIGYGRTQIAQAKALLVVQNKSNKAAHSQRGIFDRISGSATHLLATLGSAYTIMLAMSDLKETGKFVENTAAGYELVFGKEVAKGITDELIRFGDEIGANQRDLLENARSFLTVAGASMGNEKAMESFQALNILGRAGGASQEAMKRAMVGFSQLQTGEYAQSQELRQQIAENIPSVVPQIAEKMFPDMSKDKAVKAFQKGMKNNTLAVEKINEALREAAKEMRSTDAFKRMTNNLTAWETRFRNSLFKMQMQIGEGTKDTTGTTGRFTSFYKSFSLIVKSLEPTWRRLGDVLNYAILRFEIFSLKLAIAFNEWFDSDHLLNWKQATDIAIEALKVLAVVITAKTVVALTSLARVVFGLVGSLSSLGFGGTKSSSTSAPKSVPAAGSGSSLVRGSIIGLIAGYLSNSFAESIVDYFRDSEGKTPAERYMENNPDSLIHYMNPPVQPNNITKSTSTTSSVSNNSVNVNVKAEINNPKSDIDIKNALSNIIGDEIFKAMPSGG